MKVQKQTAVEFLVALGFKAAEEWDAAKVQERLAEVPSRLTIEAVPNKMHKLYNDLASAVKNGGVEVVEEEAAKPAKAGKSAKPAKAEKATTTTTKATSKKKTKAPRKERKAAERDAFGSILGSRRAKINAVLTTELQTDADIAKAAGVPLRKARLHCRRMVRKGLMVKERTIKYALKATPGKK